jgi:DNA-directed RNA polymerase subunit RPC12/RpoP
MSIRFRCPGCNRKLAAEDEDVGAVTECPDCNTEIMIPEPHPPAELPVAEQVGNAKSTGPTPVAKPVEGLMDRVETLTRSIKAQRTLTRSLKAQREKAEAELAEDSPPEDSPPVVEQAPDADSSVTIQTEVPVASNISTIKTPIATPPAEVEKKTIQAPILKKPEANGGGAKNHTSVLGSRLKKPNVKKKSGFVAPKLKTPGLIQGPKGKAPAIKAPAISKRSDSSKTPEPQNTPTPNIQKESANSAPFGVIQPIKPDVPQTIEPEPAPASFEPADAFGNCPECNAALSMANAVICIECGHQLKEVSNSKSGFFKRLGKRS